MRVPAADAAGLAWFSLQLRAQGLALEPVLVLFGFVTVLGLMGIALAVLGVKKAILRHAVRVTRHGLEIGTLSTQGTFRARQTWPLNEVAGVAAVYAPALRRSKTKALTLKRGRSGLEGSKRETLDIVGLSLSEVVDLEHRLEHELNRRGASAR